MATTAGLMQTLGPTLFTLGLNIGWGILVLVILGVLFFASRYGFKALKKRRNFKITAAIFNPDGSFYIQQIGKFRGKDNIDKMEFLGSTETCPVINPKHIRFNKVCLWRYAPGQYAVIPPTVWQKMKPEDFKIDVINLQMKNFAFLEQRAAISRWAFIKDAIQKYAPYITMLMCLIFAGVAIYFMMQVGIQMYNSNIAARTIECARLIGGGSSPTSAIIGNLTR
jgi:hypothetical protein